MCPEGFLDNDPKLSCSRKISSSFFCPFVSLCATFIIVFLLVSSGCRLHYGRKDEVCGSVNYLHLCREDEQLSETEKAVLGRKIAQGEAFAGEPSQTELLAVGAVAAFKQCLWV